tara:strand:+ start:392 stop:586 length:195 start_codon:yes stop_codon:yes gene_type:complete
MPIFGVKAKNLVNFGRKAVKAGVFASKNGGKLALMAGTMSGNPYLMSAGASASLVGQGVEKLTR